MLRRQWHDVQIISGNHRHGIRRARGSVQGSTRQWCGVQRHALLAAPRLGRPQRETAQNSRWRPEVALFSVRPVSIIARVQAKPDDRQSRPPAAHGLGPLILADWPLSTPLPRITALVAITQFQALSGNGLEPTGRGAGHDPAGAFQQSTLGFSTVRVPREIENYRDP